MTNETELWQTVLKKAVVDAIVSNDFSFFNDPEFREDFLFVCDVASMDSDRILNSIKSSKVMSADKLKFNNTVRRRGDSEAKHLVKTHFDYWSK